MTYIYNYNFLLKKQYKYLLNLSYVLFYNNKKRMKKSLLSLLVLSLSALLVAGCNKVEPVEEELVEEEVVVEEPVEEEVVEEEVVEEPVVEEEVVEEEVVAEENVEEVVEEVVAEEVVE